MIENQVGAYSELPHTIAQVVAGWLAPENVSELQAMSSRARALGRPEATFDIIRDLVGEFSATQRFRRIKYPLIGGPSLLANKCWAAACKPPLTLSLSSFRTDLLHKAS